MTADLYLIVGLPADDMPALEARAREANRRGEWEPDTAGTLAQVIMAGGTVSVPLVDLDRFTTITTQFPGAEPLTVRVSQLAMRMERDPSGTVRDILARAIRERWSCAPGTGSHGGAP